MGKKRTEELTTRKILSLKRKRPNSPDEEAIYVNPVDNNEKFIGTWENLEKSLIDFSTTFVKEAKELNEKHEITDNAREKFEEAYKTMKKSIKANQELFVEFSKYKTETLNDKKKEISSKNKKKTTKKKTTKKK